MSTPHGSSCGPGEHVTGYAMKDGALYVAKHFPDGETWTVFEEGDDRLPEFTLAAALEYARVNFT